MPSELLGEKVYQDDQLNGLTVIPRDIFARNYFHYKGGEHVVFGGPSKHGKTELAFDLLSVVATPELPAYVAVSKPTDKVTQIRGKQLGFRFVTDWPVSRNSKKWNGLVANGREDM